MPILCFEGPSAVGKTTVAAYLAAEAGAVVVPEVNALFERPADAPPAWYFERQADRWALAAEHARTHPLVVLDGDPFQPLWYNWAYGFAGRQGLDFMEAFYRPRLVAGTLGFPDRYFLFAADERTLRARKDADSTRGRGGFEAHLAFVAPQRRYFEAMRALSPNRVRLLDARAVAESADAVRTAAAHAEPEPNPVALFDGLGAWLRAHPAG